MKTIFLTCLITLFLNTVKSQISFSNIDYKLKAVAGASSTKLSCTGAAFAVECSLKKKGIKIEKNYAIVDSQVILITPLTISGLKKKTADLSNAEQKQLLANYSKYELDYFANQLHIEVINPTNQWVAIKSRFWFIWYFRVGEVPTAVETKASVQLFASTLIAGKVLTINAPVMEGGNFAKASYMVNDLMESLIIKH